MANQPDTQFEITINGITIKVKHEKLLASDVLELAARHRAISGRPEEYVLESDDPKHEFKSDEWVDFHIYKEFTAERSTPTPIAEVPLP